jgi:hypothetical protein
MLGQDVQYSREVDDKKLIQIAKTSNRILLTRDLNLYKQAVSNGVKAFLFNLENTAEKLIELAKCFDFKLEINVTISRCPKCNTRIQPVSKQQVAGKVPKNTYSFYKEFWRCPKCGQIYWRGAHWKRIKKTLEEAKEKAENKLEKK